MNRYELLIFDLNGTLVQDNLLHFECLVRAMKKFTGVTVTKKEVLPLFGDKVERILKKLLEIHHVKGDPHQINLYRHELYEKKVKKKHLLQASTFKMLKRLKKNYSLALASGSTHATLQVTLKPSERALFDILISGDEVKFGKPHPEEFLTCAVKLEIPVEKCLVIGDGLNDALAAKAAKMDFVGVWGKATPKVTLKKEGAIKVFTTINELEKWLKNYS